MVSLANDAAVACGALAGTLVLPVQLTVDSWLLRYGLYALVVGLPVAYYVHDDLGPEASYRWAWTVGAALTGVAGLFAYLWLRRSGPS